VVEVLKQNFSFKPLKEGLHETREETDFRKCFELLSVCVLTFGLNLVFSSMRIFVPVEETADKSCIEPAICRLVVLQHGVTPPWNIFST